MQECWETLALALENVTVRICFFFDGCSGFSSSFSQELRRFLLSITQLPFRFIIYLFLSFSPHRTIAGREILVAGPVVPAIPLRGFGAFFSFDTDPHRL